MVSVIIPAINESAELPATLSRIAAIPEFSEIIVSDGGSTDETTAIAQAAGCKIVRSPRGRGTQLLHGAGAASRDILLFLHADTWLEPNAGRALVESLSPPDVVGGAYWKVFRDPHWLMRGSRFRCWTRLHLFGRLAGDQAMFVKRKALDAIGGIPDVPLMEDFLLSERLRRVGRLVLADSVVSTSARRWRTRGVLRTYFLMWKLTAMHYWGRSPEQIANLYR